MPRGLRKPLLPLPRFARAAQARASHCRDRACQLGCQPSWRLSPAASTSER